ncbi:hypothetical protein CCAX7_22540 [Capsulimonas corticalis]|uniref:Uncharacterized protein n=1 Tax=Capsulimonas corticalis TaxID=2219043 RepID=A0A402CUW8_9BACT|nr:hypothetical protein [Capsulimonas corticalis]BDI30203.1 hypothetical protein CCAX7_22540 [Capsulimonas corticalis]
MSMANGDGSEISSRRVNYGWIGESWGLLGQAASPWIMSQLLYGVLVFLLSLALNVLCFGVPPLNLAGFSRWADHQTPVSNTASYALSFAFNVFQSSAYYAMAVKQVRGEQVSFHDAFRGGEGFWRMAGAVLLIGVLSLLGVAGLVIGVFFVAGLLLPAWAMVADGESPTEAITRSIRAMKGDWLKAGLFCLLFTALMGASALLCGLGLLATTPMLYLVSALAYRDMAGMPILTTQPFEYGAGQPGVWPPPPQATRPPDEPTWGAGQ